VWEKVSASNITPELVDVFDAVADVGPILPHTVKREIPHGPDVVRGTVGRGRQANLDNGSLGETYILQRLEHAIFVFGSNGHRTPKKV
jgi:hypothetical protein